ncbi:MAG: hypothetical protein M9894_31760 [Planctomycetes bacterium]|nr:hypothetical protein [Planctomycetota bacterium]
MTPPARERRPDPRLGTLVAGCRLTALLGAGAMGAAYLATREEDGAEVVVKLMAPELLSSEVARARFAREAQRAFAPAAAPERRAPPGGGARRRAAGARPRARAG